MDAVFSNKGLSEKGPGKSDKARPARANGAKPARPGRAAAEEAVRTLIAWAGDTPQREGLLETPGRVVRAYEEFFRGYAQNPDEELGRVFEETKGYEDIVLLRNIGLESHCEHHMLPILGRAHVAYLPTGKIVGISKLARVVEIYAKRLQTQEIMTQQIAACIQRVLEPAGVAVMLDAKHQCMTMRGVKKPDVATVTTQFLGVFEKTEWRERFLRLIHCP